MIFQPYSTAHRLLHNRSACEPVGEALRVTTASQQWAYAVEFPLQAVPPSGDKGLKIKLRARVHQGEIGLGVLTPDMFWIFFRRSIICTWIFRAPN